MGDKRLFYTFGYKLSRSLACLLYFNYSAYLEIPGCFFYYMMSAFLFGSRQYWFLILVSKQFTEFPALEWAL